MKNRIYNDEDDFLDSLKSKMSSSKYIETYIKLANTRCIFLNGILDKEVGSALCALLFYYDTQNYSDISLYINSPGGDASALAQVYDAMQLIKSPIQTICMSKAYSAAAVILAAGTNGKRVAFKNSNIMIHGIQCVFPIIGDHDQTGSKNYYNFLVENNDSIMKMLAHHTGKTLAVIKQDCKKDVWLTPKQALNYGIIDSIIPE